MRCLTPIICVLVAACGPTDSEKERIVQVACAVIAETRNMDAAQRVERVNDAREELGLGPFLDGDYYIVQAIQHGVCELLVLDLNWVDELENRQAEQEAAETQRRAEQQRKRRIHREKFHAGEYDDEIKRCYVLYPDNESQRRTCQTIAATSGTAR